MKQDCAIRKAKIRDAARISELLLEWLTLPVERDTTNSIEESIAKGEILVAASGSEVVGFVHYVVHDDIIDGAPNAFITALYVTEELRGRGIGSALLGRMIKEAAKLGCVEVETSAHHVGAKRFYERHGFGQSFGDIGEALLELRLTRQQS